ncbi:uncharacterized protein LOC114939313, partial [Nylanderia fulva]|uniref:uncharacterized protein LOC114939313 n=1 Tax=Nylanderia fulva TaxID=613905 RepID=UPI0010FAD31E
MSNLMANNNHSFGSTNADKVPSQNTTLPKSQPVRLLHLCESDDDDDDDESEEKPMNLKIYQIWMSQEEKSQDSHNCTLTSSRSQSSITQNLSTELSYFFHHLTKKSPLHAQSHHENVYISDMSNKKKEEHSYNTLIDNKLLHRNNEHLNLSKEDQRISKHEANEKCTPAKNPALCTHVKSSTPSLNEIQGTSLPTPINRLVLETPLKHSQVGSMHPNPCASHKQLFRTPQNKLSDNSSKNCIQTPSTILSSWCYNNTRHTPLEGKNLVAKDHMQISRNTICTPVVENSDLA